MRAREQASEMGQKAMEEARELKDKAGQKIEDMRGAPVTK
jgi:F0F1-type ATP synthase membrane subunit b/b'